MSSPDEGIELRQKVKTALRMFFTTPKELRRSFCVTLVVLVLLVVGLSTNDWHNHNGKTIGLWNICITNTTSKCCTHIKSEILTDSGSMKVSRATLIAAMVSLIGKLMLLSLDMRRCHRNNTETTSCYGFSTYFGNLVITTLIFLAIGYSTKGAVTSGPKEKTIEDGAFSKNNSNATGSQDFIHFDDDFSWSFALIVSSGTLIVLEAVYAYLSIIAEAC